MPFRRKSPTAASVAAFAAPAPAVAALALVALATSGSPAVSDVGSRGVTDTSATLYARVNPNGARTRYYFQYGFSTAYGDATKLGSAGSGTKAVAESASLKGLLPGTTYHFRVVATNSHGETISADHSLRTHGQTPPLAETGGAVRVSPSGATLTGIVNPQGAATSYFFQYGTTLSYGTQTAFQTLPEGDTPVLVSAPLAGLEPGTWFFYRLVAFHGTAESFGQAEIFMTEPAHRPRPLVRAHTSPRHARRAPFRLTTSGRIIGPARIPAGYACAGSVRIRVFRGRARLSTVTVPVQPNCAFSAVTTLKRRGSSRRRVRVRVFARFQGNGYLAPRTVGAGRVLLGS
jgi:phosphodiesterase/alkaline phosphatase D-like protein